MRSYEGGKPELTYGEGDYREKRTKTTRKRQAKPKANKTEEPEVKTEVKTEEIVEEKAELETEDPKVKKEMS